MWPRDRAGHPVRYAEHGADVVAADVCETGAPSTYELAFEDDLAETVAMARERGTDAIGLQCDVSNERDVERAVERAVEEFGRIDPLANNAGIAPVSPLLYLDEATWDRTVDANLEGMWLCAKHAGRQMVDEAGMAGSSTRPRRPDLPHRRDWVSTPPRNTG